jgi:hypothetical protein
VLIAINNVEQASLALPKFAESGNFSLNNLVIQWISVTVPLRAIAEAG